MFGGGIEIVQGCTAGRIIQCARLRLGDEVCLVSAKVPLAFVIGDAKSGDALCGQFAACNTSRMS